MKYLTYTYLICYFASSFFVGDGIVCASAAAPDDDDEAAVASSHRMNVYRSSTKSNKPLTLVGLHADLMQRVIAALPPCDKNEDPKAFSREYQKALDDISTIQIQEFQARSNKNMLSHRSRYAPPNPLPKEVPICIPQINPNNQKSAKLDAKRTLGALALSDQDRKALAATHKSAYLAYLDVKAQEAANFLTGKRADNNAWAALERAINVQNVDFSERAKNKLAAHIKGEIAEGAIITRPIPKFLQDTFEAVTLDPNQVERVLRPLVTEGRLDRSVLEHIKTRPNPWVVRGETLHDHMILNIADEYDVFDQNRLSAYQNVSPVKRFVMVPIGLIRNDGNQKLNKDIVGRMFEANSDATLVVDYGNATVADGLAFAGRAALLDSVRHISFVGENVTSIGDYFLCDCIDLTSVDLSSVPESVKSAIRKALIKSTQNRWWSGTVLA